MLKYNIKHENHDPCFFSGGCGARGEAQRGRDSGGTRQKGKENTKHDNKRGKYNKYTAFLFLEKIYARSPTAIFEYKF